MVQNFCNKIRIATLKIFFHKKHLFFLVNSTEKNTFALRFSETALRWHIAQIFVVLRVLLHPKPHWLPLNLESMPIEMFSKQSESIHLAWLKKYLFTSNSKSKAAKQILRHRLVLP
jgi:hypothetical protein